VTQSTALAEADRQAAEAALALARLTHQRIADLKAKNSATQGELDEAVANLRAAEARAGRGGARRRGACIGRVSRSRRFCCRCRGLLCDARGSLRRHRHRQGR